MTSLQGKNIQIQTSYGNINLIQFPAIKPTNQILLCLHGAYCDARIFNYLGSELAKNGFNVYSLDLPGHGKSDGPKGDLNFNDSLRAINEVIQRLRKDSTVIILGHSLGCTFALWFAKYFRNSVDGLILMAPYVRIKNIQRSIAEPSAMYLFYLLLRRIATPTARVKFTEALPSVLKGSGNEIAAMLQDPQLNFYYSYRFIIDIIAAKNSNVQKLSKVDVPILILHGKQDKLVFPSVSEEFFKIIKNPNKKLELLDSDHWFNHAVFYNQTNTRYSEESRKPVTQSIANWCSNLQHSRGREKHK